ncbi:dimethylamine monooxygenase subunit DmmA family protein [Peribacillus acanthi]|uniref:dimethylamine monooxygenase subunit DmmA family protein n=1 Tax=Peribacillus acanthi TaxID=2171554 RepID=UPI001300A264|nr:dimethylamine monooxygenase subunit DmmA family protein [Peribacillus acanthi]
MKKVRDFLQEPTFIPGKRKYLFIGDRRGMEIFKKIIGIVQETKLAYEMRLLEESENISDWLSQQKMGSFLYVAAPFETLKTIGHLVQTIGFTDEEAQYIAHGVEKRNVFCCRCHGITEIEIQVQPEIICLHCDLLMSISDHYSPILDAYLGYVAKL